MTDWHPMTEQPDPRSKVVLLYDDGSGANLYYVTDDGELIDGEDGCTYTWDERDNQSLWAYLPWSHPLWIERCDEPFTLLAPTAPADKPGAER